MKIKAKDITEGMRLNNKEVMVVTHWGDHTVEKVSLLCNDNSSQEYDPDEIVDVDENPQ